MDNTTPPNNKQDASQAVENIQKMQNAARRRTVAPKWWTALMTALAGLICTLGIFGVSRWILLPFTLLVVFMILVQSRKSGVLPRFGWRNVFIVMGLSAAFATLIYAAKTLGEENATLVSIIVTAFIILLVYVISLIERRFYSSQ